jgi:NADH-quinone oxidoreductase subunit C
LSSAEDTTATEQPPDELRTELLATLEAELGDALVGSHVRPGDDLWARVRADAWVTAGQVVHRKLQCTYFCFLSAIDWRPSPFGRYEDAEVDAPFAEKIAQPFEVVTGVAGGDTRFQVFARVTNITRHFGLTLKVDVPDDDLALDSWIPVYAGADWHERETWEMFGIEFRGHPDLKHIYLPGAFEGFPLRKDFPLLARVVKPWPGIVDVEPMPGEEAGEDGEEAAEGGDDA